MAIRYYLPKQKSEYRETVLNDDPIEHTEAERPIFPHSVSCALYCPFNYNLDISQITSNIFISDYHTARCPKVIEKYKIGAIVSIGHETYHDIPSLMLMFEDLPQINITPFLEPSRLFLHYYLTEKKMNVLIHCYAGVSRSVAICLYYLAIKNDWTYEETLKHLCERREKSCPNNGFSKTVKTILEKRKQIEETIRDIITFPF